MNNKSNNLNQNIHFDEMDNEASIVTIDKIIQKSKQWTLEGDCTLLKWMDQISKNLEERVTQTNTALTEMATRLDRTSVALSNATNNLAALQYSQFVENRVHDDDETLANIAEVPTPSTDVTDNIDVNHNVYSFLKKNLEMMNSCHEAYSISYDDSDEDEPATNVVYRSKNPYEARPLPHIYGSTLWKEKWHIGLCDSDNDFSGDEESEQFSESSSTDDESYESTAPTMSEWDSTASGLNTSHLQGRKESHTPSNDGESSCQGDNFSQSDASTPRAQRVLPIVQPVQDQRYYQHIPRKEGNQFHDIFNDSEEKVVPKVIVPPPPTTPAERKKPLIPQASLITDEPPPDEESVESDNNRRIGAKKPLNLFDDDEFSSFMDQIVQTANNKNGKVGNTTKEPPNKNLAPNLFDDSEYIVQSSTKSVAPAENTLQKAVIPNLFDDTDEILPVEMKSNKHVAPKVFNDSEDIATQPKKTQEPSKKPVIPNLFDDSDDMFTHISEPSVSQKKVASPTLEDDIFQPPPMPAVLEKTKIRNLFDDDDDDDDFERIFAAKPTGGNKFAHKTNNLFHDDLGDHFGEDSTSDNQIPENEDVPVVRKEVNEIPFLKKGLFDEDDFLIEKDIFSKITVEKKSFEDVFSKETKEKTVKSMAGLGSDLFSDVKHDGLISNKSVKNDSVKSTAIESDPSAKTLNLEEAHQNDLCLKSEMEGPAPTALKSKSVEEVDEVLTMPPSHQVDVQKISKIAPITSKAGSLAKMDLFADDFHNEPLDENVVTLEAKTKPKLKTVFADDLKKLQPNSESTEIKDLVTEIVATPNDIIVEPHPKLPEMSRGPTVPVETNIPPEAAARSDKKKINVADIFADDFTDDFDELIPKLGKGKANDAEAPIPENQDMEEVTAKASQSVAMGIDKHKSESELSFGKMTLKVADIFGDDFTDDEEFIPNLKANNSKELEKSKILDSTTLPDIAQKPTLSQPGDSKSTAPVNKKSQNELLTSDAEAVAHKDLPESSPLSTTKDQLHATTEQPTTKAPIYTSLFHDEPPPDDDNQVIPTYEEPSSDDESNATTLTKAAYNSINLFADVPPDDDDFPTVAPAETKRIHSIFYDDFHETMEASREMRAPSSYMFNDEPPPDDTDDVQSAKGDTKEQTKVLEEKKERPKVSKLKKTDLQINVGALLPTARIPLFKKSESDSKITVSDDEVSRKSVKSPERNLPDNILPNLNRDRAKVQVRRRPSTRKGRQESYRKSIIEDKVIAVVQEQDNNKENNLKKPTSLFEEIPAFGTNVIEEFKSKTIVQEIPKLATSKVPNLFDDPDNDLKAKIDLPKPPETTKIMDSLFDSDGVDENPFGTPTKTIETPPQSVATTKEVAFKSNDATSLKSDVGFIVPTAVPSAFKSVNPSPKSTSIFGESDDGSDDLFKESKTPKKPTPQKTTEKQPNPKAVSQPTKPAKSLFSSDEESGSGDDVFGKSKAKPAPKKIHKVIANPSTSLFASDDDDDDDLFGTTKKKHSAVDKSRPKTTTTRVHPVKTPALAQQKHTSISNNPLSDLLGP